MIPGRWAYDSRSPDYDAAIGVLTDSDPRAARAAAELVLGTR